MIISVCNEKGGSGKSTLCINLATKLKQDNKDVLLIDSDPQRSIEHFLNFRDEKLELPFNSLSRLGDTLGKEVKSLESKYNNIIIDTGGRDSREMRQALIVSDIVIIPIVPKALDTCVFEKMVEIVQEAKLINEKLTIVIVISKASPNPFLNKKIEQLRSYLKKRNLNDFILFKSIFYERVAFENAIFEGKGITEYNNSKAQVDFINFYEELLNIIKVRIENEPIW